MNLSVKTLDKLRVLLQEQLGEKYPEDDLQRAARAIMTLVLHKELRKRAADHDDNK